MDTIPPLSSLILPFQFLCFGNCGQSGCKHLEGVARLPLPIFGFSGAIKVKIKINFVILACGMETCIFLD